MLTVKGLGHCPSFKNSKLIVQGKGKSRPLLITKPEYRAWMDRCVDDFESQLRSLYQTTEAGMPMARSLRCWIACVMPLDDSVHHIQTIHLQAVKTVPGEEGAVIEIEPAPYAPTKL